MTLTFYNFDSLSLFEAAQLTDKLCTHFCLIHNQTNSYILRKQNTIISSTSLLTLNTDAIKNYGGTHYILQQTTSGEYHLIKPSQAYKPILTDLDSIANKFPYIHKLIKDYNDN